MDELVGLLLVAATVALAVVVWRQQQRLRILEFDLDGLRKAFLAHREASALGNLSRPVREAKAGEQIAPAPAPIDAADSSPQGAGATPLPETRGAPELPAGPGPGPTPPREAPQVARPSVETALGTRWAVWVGGLALALGGIFLIRYTIEAGIFGPEVRLTLAAVFGLVLVAAGELIRRTILRVPVEGIGNAYVPGILTAAGAFILFGTVYAAHGVYGFIGAPTAFVMLGAIGIATIAAALVHGQALAGIGIVGSYVTPLLVASQAPNAWALFVFIAIVLVAAGAIARLRDWMLLMGAAFAGAGLWTLVYLVSARPVDFAILAFAVAVTLAVLEFVWLARRPNDAGFDVPSIVPAVFVALSAIASLVDPEIGATGGLTFGPLFLIAMIAVAVYRSRAAAMLHAAGAATILVFLRAAFSGGFGFDFLGEEIAFQGFAPMTATAADMMTAGVELGAAFLVAGVWGSRRFASSAPRRAAAWAAWCAVAPLFILSSIWFSFGNPERDVPYALTALSLAIVLAAASELVARAEAPAFSGGPTVSFAIGGAGVALVLAIVMGFEPGWTTVLIGAAIVLPALATRSYRYPALGWLSVGGAVLVLLRMAVDPTIVGAANLSTTPVFNWLLAGYGVPALAAGLAARLLAQTTAGRPPLAMQAAASFFALIGAAMLVRHAMHGGVIDDGPITLAEQAIYTLIALAGSAILIAIDSRAPSPVLRIGSIAVGAVSAAMVVVQHFIALNPLLTDESTGSIPLLNLLLLAYLLPAVAAAGVSLLARGRRPRWYVAMLVLLSALLAFAYASLSLRRLFQGEFIGGWRGFGQAETYAYSALWLALGVALLVAGLLARSQMLRLASGALIVVAVAKVFLFDMSELQGVLRALSFIGLGVVLIGIGLFYQRMLRMGMGGTPAGSIAATGPQAT